jgi:hypothetical protein
MKAIVEVKLVPFSVPNFVLVDRSERGDLDSETKFKLADLAPETLDAMCEEFRSEVFKKAGKRYDRARQAVLCDSCGKQKAATV